VTALPCVELSCLFASLMPFLWRFDVPSYLDLPVANSCVEKQLRMNRRPMHDMPITDAELRTVPRTLNDAALALPFGQGPTQMSTLFAQRKHIPSALDKDDWNSIEICAARMIVGKIRVRHDGREFFRPAVGRSMVCSDKMG
jgi:hypothetical protein